MHPGARTDREIRDHPIRGGRSTRVTGVIVDLTIERGQPLFTAAPDGHPWKVAAP
ncbi:hypothetical protein Bcav_0755 [Beutenbergia cavernae DSM 12333]|uniref:Uncharacterized protein n=1 Tax=Beutenbergia cavernae (strain ATCC BAA-8 / DSM 12333 / CCUG 43141 / JCM 11478 / NBRC 16432 / NCIMB 13614 / HKI 0122) TaxID=471853 RepID=C5BYQ8_BEUC1|nr:hypothetical protein Bcav_0755 [Beutenbergia cavernae DSM 12333]